MAVTERRTQLDGTKGDPQIEVVARDMEQLGYTFEWQCLDSANFFVGQRRRRCWGTAERNFGSLCHKAYKHKVKHNVNHLVSSNRIPIHLQLDETLPPVDLQLDRQREVLTAAQAKAEYYKSVGLSNSIFVTLTQSLERGPDLGVDITPCLRQDTESIP